MIVLVTYDVSTGDATGRARLRKIAQACVDWGQRVQYSVFEIEVKKADWVALRSRLLDIIDEKRDSLRFYAFDSDVRDSVEHHGVRRPLDLNGPLIV